MKSPTSSVGTIELDGILNGSTRNERSRNTIRITGKKLIEYSTHHGCFSSLAFSCSRMRAFFSWGSCLSSPSRRESSWLHAASRLRRSATPSTAHTKPVTSSKISRNRAKFKARSSFPPLQHREKRLLGDLDRADLLHALLPLLLLLQQLALARDIAAVAFRQHVLAQRLHILARDDMAADRRLDRDVEHLARNQGSQLVDQLASPMLRARAVYHA